MRLPHLTEVALVSALVILASAEFFFGEHVLGLPHAGPVPLAIAVPVFLDSYVISAFRSRRPGDVIGAVCLISLSVGTGTIAHFEPFPVAGRVSAAAVFGLVVAVVLWRVEEITITGHQLADRLKAAESALLAAQDVVRELEAGQAAVLAQRLEAQRRELAAEQAAKQAHPAPVVSSSPAAKPTVRVPAPVEPGAKLTQEQGMEQLRKLLARDRDYVCGRAEQTRLTEDLGMSASWWEKRWADVRRPRLVAREGTA